MGKERSGCSNRTRNAKYIIQYKNRKIKKNKNRIVEIRRGYLCNYKQKQRSIEEENPNVVMEIFNESSE